MKTIILPPNTRVFDRDDVITEAEADALVAEKVEAVARCIDHISRPDANVTRAEIEMLQRKRLAVILYQQYLHDAPFTAETGRARGALSVATCKALGWPDDGPCNGDLEGNGASHADGVAFLTAWNGARAASGLPADQYLSGIGFAFTTAELDASGTRSWWRSGGRPPHDPTAGYDLVQGGQITIGGAVYDVDVVTGSGMRAVVADDDPRAGAPSPPAPAPAPAPPPPAAFAPQLGPPYPAPPAGFMWKLATESTDDEIAEFIAMLARPCAGLSDAPATRVAFRDAVGPPWLEGPSLSAAMAGSWCCAEFGEGLLRYLLQYASAAVRVRLHAFRRYVVEMAMGWVIEDAQALGCKKTHSDGLPRKGASVIIDGGFHDIGAIVGDVAEGKVAPTVEGGNTKTVEGHTYMAILAGERVFHASGAIGGADGKTLHHEYVWLDWVLGMRNAAKIDPRLSILVPAPPPPQPAPVPPPPAPIAPSSTPVRVTGLAAAVAELAHLLHGHPAIAWSAGALAALLLVVLAMELFVRWRARRAAAKLPPAT